MIWSELARIPYCVFTSQTDEHMILWIVKILACSDHQFSILLDSILVSSFYGAGKCIVKLFACSDRQFSILLESI